MKKSILLTILILTILLAACSGEKNAAIVVPTVTAQEVSNTIMPTPAPSPTAAQPAPMPPPEADLAMLRANPWYWVAYTNPMEQTAINKPQNYVVTFNDDASVNIMADCNNANGAYVTDGSSITITVGPMTMAACPHESRSDEFIKYLGFARIYFFGGNNLFIDLFADGGTLEFAPLGETTGAAETIPEANSPDALAGILGNLSYTGIVPGQTIKLINGYAAYEDGSSAKPFVRFLDQLIATGDLNGDGKEDAVALLEDQTSGTGRFIFAVPVLDAWRNPAPAEALMIGDRISVKSLVVDNSQVVAELIAQGPGDAACCASWNVRKAFNLEDGRLVEKSSEELSKVSLADLSDTTWRLIDLNSLNPEPALPDTEITLRLSNDQLSGFAGCNSYNAMVNSQEGSPLSFIVGPIATTKKICPESVMNQEQTYLSHLGKAISWWYDAGRLALTYELDEGGYGNLTFETVLPAGEGTAPATETDNADLEALTTTTWSWVGFTNPLEQYRVENPENYTLTFKDDGAVEIVADCNKALGSYTLNGSSIEIELSLVTIAACPPESRSDEFIRHLGFARHYFFKDSNLFMDLFADGGTLEFAPAK